MIQKDIDKVLKKSIRQADSINLADQVSFVSSMKESRGLLNSIEVSQSRMTLYQFDGVMEKSHESPKMQPSAQNPCISCQLWQKWAKNTEISMLSIEKTLIQKQKKLQVLVESLKSTIFNLQTAVKQKNAQLSSQKEKYEINAIEFKREKQQLLQNIQLLSISHPSQSAMAIKKNLVFKDADVNAVQNAADDGVEGALKIIKSMKKEKTSGGGSENTNSIRKAIEKSRFNQTATDCSFLRDNADMVTEIEKSVRAIGNPEYAQECSRDEEIRNLTFQNQNLKAYNKVLLQKLSNSRPRKY